MLQIVKSLMAHPGPRRGRADCSAERGQSCAFGLKCGQALVTREPGAGPHVKMQPVLDDLAFGNALEEQPQARTLNTGPWVLELVSGDIGKDAQR